MVRYAFGDGDLAAERLEVLDAAFAPSADALLRDLDVHPARIADLGCGPAVTTRRLTARFPGATVVGIDASAASSSREARGPAATFVVADVTRPLPHGPFPTSGRTRGS
jgi:trans-aconitate methyltransferase